jgi:hypothetical protein
MDLYSTAAGIAAAAIQPDISGRCDGADMAAQHHIHLIHKTVITNGFCTTENLFCGLEDKLDTALNTVFHAFYYEQKH